MIVRRLVVAISILVTVGIVGARGQTSNSLPFTAQTPPPPPTLTTLGNLSPTGKIYTGQVMPINGTNFTPSCVVNVDGTPQPATTYIFSSPTLINYTVPASLGSGSGTSHALTVSCPLATLTLNSPVTLPNPKVAVAYTANLGQLATVQGGILPLTYSLTTGALPTGLTLSPSGIVSGTPSGAGSFTFNYNVKDSTLITTNYNATLNWVASTSQVAGYNAYRRGNQTDPTLSLMLL